MRCMIEQWLRELASRNLSLLTVYLLRRVRRPRVHGRRTGRVLGGRLRGGHGRAPRHVPRLLGRLLGTHFGTQ